VSGEIKRPSVDERRRGQDDKGRVAGTERLFLLATRSLEVVDLRFSGVDFRVKGV
jgi:hypothetical protein